MYALQEDNTPDLVFWFRPNVVCRACNQKGHVEKVCKNYGTDEEKQLDYLSVSDAKKLLAEGEFEAQTMAPKIQAAVDYIGDSAIRKALITKLSPDSVAGEKAGTMIGK